MSNIKVSIIIPVYNVESFLDKCLNSVLNQKFEGYEVICVNDGSTDNSLEILKKYESKNSIIKIIDQHNKGLAGARNSGYKNAQGKFIYFLDSDDWIDENLLKDTYELITGTNSDVVAFDINNVYPNKSIIPVRRGKNLINKYKTNIFYFSDIKDIEYLNCSAWSKLYRKEFLEKHNLSFPEHIRISEDVPFWFELLLCNPKIYVTDKCYYFYRKRNNSLSSHNINCIENVYNSYCAFKSNKRYNSASKLEKLYILDYFCRLAVYPYSTNEYYNLYPALERSLNLFSNEYKQYNEFNLWKMRGYVLLKARIPYTIGKKIILKLLQTKNKEKNNII